MTGLLSSEWLKLRSARSTWCAIGVVVLLLVGTAALFEFVAVVYDHASEATRAHISIVPAVGLSGQFSEPLLGVVGALAVTGEYRTGAIRSSLVAVPDRLRYLAAKVVVIAVSALVAGETIVFAGYGISRVIVGDRPVILDDSDLADQLPLLLAHGALIAVFALIGLGLGTVLRSAAGTIVCIVAVWYIVPIMANMLPEPWHARIGSVTPDALPGQIAGVGNPHSVYGELLPPWAAALVLVGYAAVPLAAAALLLHRRDVR